MLRHCVFQITDPKGDAKSVHDWRINSVLSLFIFPNDRVDDLARAGIEGGKKSAPHKISKTVLPVSRQCAQGPI